MTITAALLDERGVFLRMDEVENLAALTDRHLPQIVECDLPAGQYLWIPDTRKRPDGRKVNVYDGAFHEVAWLRRLAATRTKAAGVRAQNGRADPVEKSGVETQQLVDFLAERGLA